MIFFGEKKRPVHDADHKFPSNAEVNNEWIYASTSPLRLRDLHRNGFACNLKYGYWAASLNRPSAQRHTTHQNVLAGNCECPWTCLAIRCYFVPFNRVTE